MYPHGGPILFVPMSMCPRLYLSPSSRVPVSMCVRLHVSVSMCPVSMCLCLYVMCSRLCVSPGGFSLCSCPSVIPFLCVPISICPCLYVTSGFQRGHMKTEKSPCLCAPVRSYCTASANDFGSPFFLLSFVLSAPTVQLFIAAILRDSILTLGEEVCCC